MKDDNTCTDYLARQAMLGKVNDVPNNVGTKTLIEKITKWHHDRNLIEGATDKDQFCKLMQEAGELSDSICKGKDVSDDIGDMMVVLINIAERNGLSISECLSKAWDDIKDRKGKMIDGVFVKEADLNEQGEL
jgi:uncharacterized protein YabN with tetrapyrrole methylase and pyrophosphatase domain